MKSEARKADEVFTWLISKSWQLAWLQLCKAAIAACFLERLGGDSKDLAIRCAGDNRPPESAFGLPAAGQMP
jgi:hypothetical protein